MYKSTNIGQPRHHSFDRQCCWRLFLGGSASFPTQAPQQLCRASVLRHCKSLLRIFRLRRASQTHLCPLIKMPPYSTQLSAMTSDAMPDTGLIPVWMTAYLQYVISSVAGKSYLLRTANVVLTRRFKFCRSDLWVVGSLGSLCMAMINLQYKRAFEAKIMLDKALCYFQPILQVGATVGTASFNEIRTAANALLSQCATGQGQGGIATKLGMSFTTSQNALDEPSKRIGNSPSGWTLIFDRRRWQPCSHSRYLFT